MFRDPHTSLAGEYSWESHVELDSRLMSWNQTDLGSNSCIFWNQEEPEFVGVGNRGAHCLLRGHHKTYPGLL